MMTIALVLARDGGSLLRKELLDETEQVIKYLNSNFTTEHDGVTLR